MIEDEAGEHRPQARPGCDQTRHAAGVRNLIGGAEGSGRSVIQLASHDPFPWAWGNIETLDFSSPEKPINNAMWCPEEDPHNRAFSVAYALVGHIWLTEFIGFF